MMLAVHRARAGRRTSINRHVATEHWSKNLIVVRRWSGQGSAVCQGCVRGGGPRVDRPDAGIRAHAWGKRRVVQHVYSLLPGVGTRP
jgi:hypothetical protein